MGRGSFFFVISLCWPVILFSPTMEILGPCGYFFKVCFPFPVFHKGQVVAGVFLSQELVAPVHFAGLKRVHSFLEACSDPFFPFRACRRATHTGCFVTIGAGMRVSARSPLSAAPSLVIVERAVCIGCLLVARVSLIILLAGVRGLSCCMVFISVAVRGRAVCVRGLTCCYPTTN
jgi:hypothetical protein